MKRKTTCLALVGKWGGLGDIKYGCVVEAGPPPESAACAEVEKKPDRDSTSIKPRPAKPPPTSQRNCRRERPHGVGLGMKRDERGAVVIGYETPRQEGAGGTVPQTMWTSTGTLTPSLRRLAER